MGYLQQPAVHKLLSTVYHAMLVTCRCALLPTLAAGTLGYLLLSQGLNRRTVTTLLLSLALATSQDLLAARNTGSLQQLLANWGVSGRMEQQQQQQQPQQPPVAASKTTLQVCG